MADIEGWCGCCGDTWPCKTAKVLAAADRLAEAATSVKRFAWRFGDPSIRDGNCEARMPWSVFLRLCDSLADYEAKREKGKRALAIISRRNDERAVGWFIVDESEGVVGAYETREDAEAARREIYPDPGEREETSVAEVGFLGPLRSRIGELEELLGAIAEAAAPVADLSVQLGSIAERARKAVQR